MNSSDHVGNVPPGPRGRFPDEVGPDEGPQPGGVLGTDDRDALDALVETGFDLAAVRADLRPRAAALARVLGLLEVRPRVGDGGVLFDVTVARVARQRISLDGCELSPGDDEALESLVSAGLDAAHVPGAVKERAERLQRLLSLLDVAPPGAAERDRLVDRTLARVQGAIASDERRRVFAPEARRGWRSVRVADLVSVAAMLLIATAVLGPVFGAVRDRARQSACQANLMGAGMGFGLYAQDNRDTLPMASACLAGMNWMLVGEDPAQSNSANLYTLARTGYVKLRDLACSGNQTACRQDVRPGSMDWQRMDEVSYSMQNLFARERPRMGAGPRAVLIADRSPVVLRASRHELVIFPFENSPNHGGRGQSVLFNDGASIWLSTPIMDNGDNLWLPRFIEQVLAQRDRDRPPTQADPMKGIETPAAATDAFLVP